jgi:hypothetical protein
MPVEVKHAHALQQQPCPKRLSQCPETISAEPKWHHARAVSSLAKQILHFNEWASGTEHITATDPRHGKNIKKKCKV